jgi:alpha-ketoglutarate-dependent 2,4-dichlorophenoxyacetate dioxygenase
VKKDLVSNNYVGCHTLAQSRKLGSPEFFKNVEPHKFPMARHRLVQIHEGSGRATLYVGAHLHHIEGLSEEKSVELRDMLNKHATQPKYTYTFEWEQPGDIVMWDNRAVLHRATGGTFVGKYRRDLRRTTVHDDSAHAWGLNNKDGVSALGYRVGADTRDTAEFTPAQKSAQASVASVPAYEPAPVATPAPAPVAAAS